MADHLSRLTHAEGGSRGLGLPLIFRFIFCTEIEGLELFGWRFEFNYRLFKAVGLFGHPIALEIQASCMGGKERSRGGGWGEVRAGKVEEEKMSEKVLKFCA